MGIGAEGHRVRSSSANTRVSPRRRTLLIATVIAILAVGALALALSRDRATVGTLPNAPSGSTTSAVASAGADALPQTAEGVSGEPTGSPEVAPSSSADAETLQVVPAGTKLAVVPASPPGTLGSLRLPDDVSKARLAVVFDVYGWAPNGPGGARRLSVRVTSVKPMDSGPRIQELAGANAVFSLASYDGLPVTEGGRYEGTLQVRAEEGGRGAMYLMGARRVQ